jgi:Metal-independent alpha-mannosidase (GH125)
MVPEPSMVSQIIYQDVHSRDGVSCAFSFGTSVAINLSAMQGILSRRVLVALVLVPGIVEAQCPDYSIYSQQRHQPFSTGKYSLSYMRPHPACRTFNSSDVEDTIVAMKEVIKDPDLYRLFENSFPNSLDTAVKWKGVSASNAEEELTFLITGDINVRVSSFSLNHLTSISCRIFRSLLQSEAMNEGLTQQRQCGSGTPQIKCNPTSLS